MTFKTRVLQLSLAVVLATAASLGAERADAHGIVVTANLVAVETGTSTGSAEMEISDETGKICLDLTLVNVDEPQLVVITKGPGVDAETVVVELQMPSGNDPDCTFADVTAVEGILADVASHYLTVTTQAEPTGAIQGRLEKPLPPSFPPQAESASPSLSENENSWLVVPSVVLVTLATISAVGWTALRRHSTNGTTTPEGR